MTFKSHPDYRSPRDMIEYIHVMLSIVVQYLLLESAHFVSLKSAIHYGN